MHQEWLEIAVPVAADTVDEVAGLLVQGVEAAQSGTEIRREEVVFWVPVELGEAALAAARRRARELANAGFAVRDGAVVARPALPELEWRDAWKRYFRTTRMTRQLVIVPSWDSFSPAGDDLELHLDPGQAFGTGDHATTRLLLSMLQELRDAGFSPESLLDAGTGSGILAIAAARLWPSLRGLGVDIDPIAVDAARENFERNQVGDRLRASQDRLETLAGPFDLLLANIQADVLLPLCAPLAGALAPGGRLLLSGLLAEQAELVVGPYCDAGLLLCEQRPDARDPSWVAAVMERPR